jgi:hypothetical protein
VYHSLIFRRLFQAALTGVTIVGFTRVAFEKQLAFIAEDKGYPLGIC